MNIKLNSHSIIRLIALSIAGIGCYIIFQDGRSYWFFLCDLFGGRNLDVSRLIIADCFFALLLVLLRIISGYGLFLFRNWARTISLFVLWIDFLFRLYSPIRYCCLFLFGNQDLIIPPSGDNVTVIEISMWPSYVIAIINIISVYFLTREWIVKEFIRVQSKNSPGQE